MQASSLLQSWNLFPTSSFKLGFSYSDAKLRPWAVTYLLCSLEIVKKIVKRVLSTSKGEGVTLVYGREK